MGDGYPEGTHPARAPGETEFSADKLSYKDNPDKPAPSSVAQVVDVPGNWPGQ